MKPVILLKPMSSLEKCFLDENILFKPTTDRFTVFRGQPLCFQVAVSRGDEGEIGRSAAKSRLPVSSARAMPSAFLPWPYCSIVPTIMRTTQESLKTVPQSYREGAFGLGAGKWRVVRTVVLPNCLDGIITGCILAAGRVLGESAALLYTAGFAHAVHGLKEGLLSPGASLTVALYVYAKEQGEFEVAFAIAAVLMLLTLVLNLLAGLVQKGFKRRTSQ